MKKIPVAEFIARGERGLRELLRSADTIVLTDSGKPVARIEPIPQREGKNLPGKLKHTLVSMKDVVSPLGAEMWEAAR